MVLLGLAPGGVCLAAASPRRRCALTAPFHPCRRRDARATPSLRRLFSVALSRGFPRVGLAPTTLALRCPDFPRTTVVSPPPAAAWPAPSMVDVNSPPARVWQPHGKGSRTIGQERQAIRGSAQEGHVEAARRADRERPWVVEQGRQGFG